MSQEKTVFVTGATGTMGKAFLKIYASDRKRYPYRVRVLARRSDRNERLLAPYQNRHGVEVIWGDLNSPESIRKGVEGADYILHVGGMVSPAADYHPELTMKVNVSSMQSIVDAVKSLPGQEKVHIVYIGSVSQYGSRHRPLHWGRCGDPMWGASFDHYAHSKIAAERILAESGLRNWVSLRQTGILSPLILKKGTDPITFHVPLRGVLEWITEEESGRLLANIPVTPLPETFWRNFYNIGGGESYRLTNYEFMALMMKSMHCPQPEKAFSAKWFALRNFHGIWYQDSDQLEEYLHFRSGKSAEEYFSDFSRSLPWFFRLAAIVPPSLIKGFMRYVAGKKPFGPLYWEKRNDDARIRTFFGNRRTWERQPDWDGIAKDELSGFETAPKVLDHGYDESIPDSELSLKDMRQAAAFRGGTCLTRYMRPGDLDTPMEWYCHAGHRFTATPRLILKGGHWCPECFNPDTDLDKEAASNPFFSQVWDAPEQTT